MEVMDSLLAVLDEETKLVRAGRVSHAAHLEHTAEAGPGDFIYVPAYLVHQEINPSDAEDVAMIVSRSTGENITVNVDIPEGRDA